MTFCKNCGAKLNPQDEFCPNCGTKNETPQQPQQPDGMGADAVTAVPGGKKPFLGMNTKGLLIAAGCIVVTAVLVICPALLLFRQQLQERGQGLLQSH